MEKKRLKVKVKKRKLNLKKVLLFLIIAFLLYSVIMKMISSRIKNIYVMNNEIVSDKEILEDLEIIDYPSFYDGIVGIKKRLSNPYIKKVEVKRKFGNRLYLNIVEYKPLALYNDKILLENGSLLNNMYNIDYVPYLVNDITVVFDNFVSSFTVLDRNILYRISEIKYVPTDVDSERFLLYMTDGNSVYITLNKINKLNKYDIILQKMAGKKGIVYLDSGDYVEIKH